MLGTRATAAKIDLLTVAPASSRPGRRAKVFHSAWRDGGRETPLGRLYRIKAGESLRTIVKSYRVHHSTISRLAG